MTRVLILVLVFSISFAWGYSNRANEDKWNTRSAALAVHFEMQEAYARDMQKIGVCAWSKMMAARALCKETTP